MSLAGPSTAVRVGRMVNAGIALAPIPWINAIVLLITEVTRRIWRPSSEPFTQSARPLQIHDIVQRVKMFRPQCKRLAEDSEKIANALEEHGKAHPGNSKLEDLKDDLLYIVQQIRDDLLHWANFKWFMRYYRHRDVLEAIDNYRGSLEKTTKELVFKGTLLQDVDSAKKDEELRVVQAEVDELKQRMDKEAQKTSLIKEEWIAAKMIGIDEIEEAEEAIFSLRLDPENFPDADMQGEVAKLEFEPSRIGDTFDVFKAAWFDRKCVAAKRFRGRDYGMTPTQERRFTRQMNIWRTLKHPNVVPVFGICKFEAHRPPYLISPWMKYGNVRDYLKEFGEKADRLKLIHEIALGLQYIHSVGVLHGNLNPTNVLVNINHCVRLTGFSVSKKLQEDNRYTNSNNNSQTFRWWSPESIHCQILSEQSDIWSWGMTALEILSGEYPFKDEKSPLAVINIVGERDPEPEDYDKEIASDAIWALMKDCWKPYGTRPDIGQVVSVLRQERITKGWNPDAPPPEPLFDREYPEMF